ncbi:SurA N-terminal domain-containing protein [Marinobacter sp. F4216]|uniref:SurA N-terminal domain-containing protein n=1 Tax=Marinobacter sp. F4216 TaxID=2874281 RepID=UPI001CBAF5A0|nr:SurA N-terminal domain-containing protein [Marinobacter sp. F4216]MBZ2167702.1 SurA N-terminal domain-containing protein [Marinobacter sp. F4216]
MLQDIRENAQSTIAKVIVGLLIVTLSLWGVDAIIGGIAGEPEVATVNGEEITEREFLRLVQLESQSRLSRMETPDPSLLNEDRIRQEVLESLIQQQVLTQDADEQGLALDKADVDALITQMPQFQIDGKFNAERFTTTVRNMGMGVQEFRDALRKQYVINQIRAGIVQSGLVPNENAERLMRIQNQTRDFRTLSVAADSVAEDVEVTDAEIEAFYEDNSQAFQQPEQVDAAYITLSLGALAEGIEVSDEDLQAYYEQRSSDLAREERRAAHILIEDGESADETMATIQERLAAGESFADLAQEFSADAVSAKEGGDLGFAGRGVYDQAFEEALFALDEGELSEPVETSFGVHLIKLEDVRRSEVPALAEIEQQLRSELARERAEDKFIEVRTRLADAAYAADDLAGPAEELGLEIREVEGVTRNGGPAPFDHEGLVRQLFSVDVLEDSYNTELIDVGDSVSVVARVREYREAQQLDLDQVANDIRAQLVAQKTREALQDRAQQVVDGLESGQSLEELGVDGEWIENDAVGRGATGFDLGVVQTVFTMQRPEESGSAYGHSVTADEATVIALDAVNDGEVAEGGAEFKQLAQFLASLEGQREYAAYQEFLRDQADVERP